ncbi:MAG: hypothetical protein ACKVI7_06925 [Rhodobacterales bacterium]
MRLIVKILRFGHADRYLKWLFDGSKRFPGFRWSALGHTVSVTFENYTRDQVKALPARMTLEMTLM